jgi:hypothetical protein
MGGVAVEAEIVAFNRHVEAIAHEGDQVRTPYVIASFVARWTSRRASMDEVDAVDWIDPAGPLSPTTRGLGEILASAARIASQSAVAKM